MGVCGSVVLFYGRLCLRRLFSAFWDNVLIYGRFWRRRPLLWAFGSPSFSFELFRTNASPEGVSGQRPHIWAFAALSSSFMGVCASAHSGRLCLLFFAVAGLFVVRLWRKVSSVSNTFPNAETSSESLQLALLVRCWFSSEELLQVDSGARMWHSLHQRDPLREPYF